MRVLLTAILLTVSIAFAAHATGDNVINPVSATSSLPGDFGTDILVTIDGTGLSEFPSLSATHEATIPTNSFVVQGNAVVLDFNLGGNYFVDGFAFWNQNGGGPGGAGSTGIQDVIVSASTDGINFTEIPGAPDTFALVAGAGDEAPELFSFGAVQASDIRFEVLSSHGDTFNVGFAEVAFSGSVVPEPGATAGMAALFIALLCKKRRHSIK